VINAKPGPIPFPDLTEKARQIELAISRAKAEIEAYRSMAVLGGSAQWPQVKAGLSQQLNAMVERLVNERDMEVVPRIQERVKVYREILAAPETAEKAIGELANRVETLQNQLAAANPPRT